MEIARNAGRSLALIALAYGVIAIAVLAAAACSQSDRAGASKAVDDAFVVARIRARAASIDAATVSLVHVTYANGIATLDGRVRTATERTSIERATSGVAGVTAVVDRIHVDPSAPTGAEIESDLALATSIHAALVAQTGVNAASIHVDVHRGVVTLTGTLPSAAHREVADETVRSVHGVKQLIDEITVH
jgi:osmotically-inducible protein OsmY